MYQAQTVMGGANGSGALHDPNSTITSYYSLPQLAALAHSYRQLAEAAVEEGTTQVHTRQETAQKTAVEAP